MPNPPEQFHIPGCGRVHLDPGFRQRRALPRPVRCPTMYPDSGCYTWHVLVGAVPPSTVDGSSPARIWSMVCPPGWWRTAGSRLPRAIQVAVSRPVPTMDATGPDQGRSTGTHRTGASDDPLALRDLRHRTRRHRRTARILRDLFRRAAVSPARRPAMDHSRRTRRGSNRQHRRTRTRPLRHHRHPEGGNRASAPVGVHTRGEPALGPARFLQRCIDRCDSGSGRSRRDRGQPPAPDRRVDLAQPPLRQCSGPLWRG